MFSNKLNYAVGYRQVHLVIDIVSVYSRIEYKISEAIDFLTISLCMQFFMFGLNGGYSI